MMRDGAMWITPRAATQITDFAAAYQRFYGTQCVDSLLAEVTRPNRWWRGGATAAALAAGMLSDAPAPGQQPRARPRQLIHPPCKPGGARARNAAGGRIAGAAGHLISG